MIRKDQFYPFAETLKLNDDAVTARIDAVIDLNGKPLSSVQDSKCAPPKMRWQHHKSCSPFFRETDVVRCDLPMQINFLDLLPTTSAGKP